MLDGSLFSALSEVASAVRNVDEPFGGLQLVTCGDFFQLPPVPNNKGTDRTFAFQSRAWVATGLETHSLHEIIRQRGDPGFVPMLNEIREGVLSTRTLQMLEDCHVSTSSSSLLSSLLHFPAPFAFSSFPQR